MRCYSSEQEWTWDSMAIKGHSTFPKAPVLLDAPHLIASGHMQETRWESLISLQRYSRYILLPKSTRPSVIFKSKIIFYFQQFSLAKGQFFCLHTLKCENSSILNNSVYHKNTVYFYLNHRYDPIKCYHSGPEWTRERRQ